MNEFSCHYDSQYIGKIAHLSDYRTEFVKMCQNFLELAKFQTLTTSPLVSANLQTKSCLVNL